MRPITLLAALAFSLVTCLPARANTRIAAANVTVSAPRIEQAPRLEDFARAMEDGGQPQTAMMRVEGFLNRLPRDDEPLSEATVAYLGRDADALYVVFLCHARDPSAVRAHRVARDRLFDDDDSVAVQIDTYRDFRRAYGLQANVAGAKRDGYWIEGSGWSFDPDFDYRIEGMRTTRGYVVKYTIPFAAIDYPRDSDTWGLMLMRAAPATSETAFWPRYSRKVQGRMNQAAHLEGMADAPRPSRGEIVPYFASRRVDLRGEDSRSEADVGLDARVRVGRASELSLALNPDFSQVESDEPQIAANQRFELFFPEKRPFFSDHARYFETPLNLLFTRRLADPRYGLKLTGQSNDTTWAALAVRDEGTVDADRDLVAGRLRYDASDRLSLAMEAVALVEDEQRNTVAALDTRWRASDRWMLHGQLAASRDSSGPSDGDGGDGGGGSGGGSNDGGSTEGAAGVLRLQGTGPTWTYDLTLQALDDDFHADAGFITRTGVLDTHQVATWRHYPTTSGDASARSLLLAIGPDLTLDHVTDESGLRLDSGAELAIVAELPHLTTLSVFGGPRHTRLLPSEFPELTRPADFSAGRTGAKLATSFGWGALTLQLTRGERVNVVPPVGSAPSQARFREASLSLGLRTHRSLTNENTLLYTRLEDDRSDTRVFDLVVARSKWSYFFTSDWSVRCIAQYQRTRANPGATRLVDDEGANLDLLMAWQPTPSRALYVGANTDYDVPPGVDETRFPGRLDRRAASVYVKFSWSFELGAR